jgi:hypothetical protein
VELLQTTSQTLQAKLDQLTALGLSNDRAGFCRQFVPLDLGAADVQGYLEDLTTHPEADGQWNNLVAEIAAIRSGKGVDRIEGDQLHNAVFYFTHPLLLNCDREVAFVYCNIIQITMVVVENGEPKDNMYAMVCRLECNQQQTMHSCMDQIL